MMGLAKMGYEGFGENSSHKKKIFSPCAYDVCDENRVWVHEGFGENQVCVRTRKHAYDALNKTHMYTHERIDENQLNRKIIYKKLDFWIWGVIYLQLETQTQFYHESRN
jgi:hypothetical protein